ncbi:subtilisin-like protease SBT1.5 [Phoenix dactylifera]|uniref:Subtilisin-like protease SBT1.5 n=1 Tax=Phoenix dactylifera TaxID=42345 RepID=A0A8B8JC87_PHODC|nr:subtilisin-like protease SBT1.5 [Phoenix dactylifera]
MAFSPPFLLLIFLAFFLSLSSALGDAAADTSTPKTYIISVRNDLKPSVFSDAENWYTSSILHALSSSTDSLESSSRRTHGIRKPLHVYRTVFVGFSAVLSSAEADLLRSDPAVLAVLPDRPRQLHTTRSPLFLGLVSADSKPNRLLAAADSGSSVVIALVDTGIRPDHPSFANDGRLPPPPARWNGSCDHGPHFPATSCNRKLVGARFFDHGYLANTQGGIGKGWDVFSPLDSQGHGTHTASTAAGGAVPNASLRGYAAGVASGIAPRARIAVYKACWASGCYDSDIIAAIDAAVTDGAHVISISLGAGVVPLQVDPVAISTLGAAERGVFVAASAGNEGPLESTVGNVAPWVTTVGAGAMDRRFPADIILGDGTVVSGFSIHIGRRFSPKRSFPLVYAANASQSDWEAPMAAFCGHGYLDPNKVRRKIVLCDRGELSRVEKGWVVKHAGGVAMILANEPTDGEGATPDAHILPAVSVGYKAGRAIKAYISANDAPRVRLSFHGTQVGVKPAPAVAGFSARGPSLHTPHVIKPDLIAPGVSILAAWPDRASPTGLKADRRRTEFNIISGTSMSCPHIAGVAALLKDAHPDWSPAAIRSAMMTTAYATDSMGQDLVDESTGNRSTEWAYGSGHVDPEKAVDPGLVYDLTVDDYLDFMCSSSYSSATIEMIARRQVNCSEKIGRPWDLNYPSIAVTLEQSDAGKLEAVVHRTVMNVGEDKAKYTVSIKEPKGVLLAVEPRKLVFGGRGRKQEFVVKVSTEPMELQPWTSWTEFGSVTWSDGKHKVRSPIAVTWQRKD